MKKRIKYTTRRQSFLMAMGVTILLIAILCFIANNIFAEVLVRVPAKVLMGTIILSGTTSLWAFLSYRREQSRWLSHTQTAWELREYSHLHCVECTIVAVERYPKQFVVYFDAYKKRYSIILSAGFEKNERTYEETLLRSRKFTLFGANEALQVQTLKAWNGRADGLYAQYVPIHYVGWPEEECMPQHARVII